MRIYAVFADAFSDVRIYAPQIFDDVRIYARQELEEKGVPRHLWHVRKYAHGIRKIIFGTWHVRIYASQLVVASL